MSIILGLTRTKDPEMAERVVEKEVELCVCVCVGDHSEAVCGGGIVCVCVWVDGWCPIIGLR